MSEDQREIRRLREQVRELEARATRLHRALYDIQEIMDVYGKYPEYVQLGRIKGVVEVALEAD